MFDIKSKAVQLYDKNNELAIKTFYSITVCVRFLGIHQSTAT